MSPKSPAVSRELRGFFFALPAVRVSSSRALSFRCHRSGRGERLFACSPRGEKARLCAGAFVRAGARDVYLGCLASSALRLSARRTAAECAFRFALRPRFYARARRARGCDRVQRRLVMRAIAPRRAAGRERKPSTRHVGAMFSRTKRRRSLRRVRVTRATLLRAIGVHHGDFNKQRSTPVAPRTRSCVAYRSREHGPTLPPERAVVPDVTEPRGRLRVQRRALPFATGLCAHEDLASERTLRGLSLSGFGTRTVTTCDPFAHIVAGRHSPTTIGGDTVETASSCHMRLACLTRRRRWPCPLVTRHLERVSGERSFSSCTSEPSPKSLAQVGPLARLTRRSALPTHGEM